MVLKLFYAEIFRVKEDYKAMQKRCLGTVDLQSSSPPLILIAINVVVTWSRGTLFCLKNPKRH